MRTAILIAFLGLSLNAQAAHWDCKGTQNLEKISFDLTASVEHFTVVAPDLEQKGLQESFQPVNSFTLVAYQVLDNKAQETIDFTVIIDAGAKSVSVLSQWSTNENVDVDPMSCVVSE